MNTKFDFTPMCEICGNKEATHFSAVNKNNSLTDWKFVCGDCERTNWEYPIPIRDFFASSKSILEWLDHLNEKIGMDWQSFMDMIHRFKQCTEGDDGSLERYISERLGK